MEPYPPYFLEDILSDHRPSDMTHLNAQNQIEDYNHQSEIIPNDQSRNAENEVFGGTNLEETYSKEADFEATKIVSSKPNINKPELTQSFVSDFWESWYIPGILEFVRIPNLTPMVDADYQINGLLQKAMDVVDKFIN